MYVCAYEPLPTPSRVGEANLRLYCCVASDELAIYEPVEKGLKKFSAMLQAHGVGVDFASLDAIHRYDADIVIHIVNGKVECDVRYVTSPHGVRQYVINFPDIPCSMSILYHLLGHVLGLRHQIPPWSIWDLHRLADYVCVPVFERITGLYQRQIASERAPACTHYHADVMDIGVASNLWYHGCFRDVGDDNSLEHFSEASLATLRRNYGHRDPSGSRHEAFDAYLSFHTNTE